MSEDQLTPVSEPVGQTATPEQDGAPMSLMAEAGNEPKKDFATENVEFQKEGKLGEFGSYSAMADLQPGGDLVAKADATVDKKFLDFVTVKLSLKAEVDASLMDAVFSWAEKSDKVWVQKVAAKLKGLIK